MEAGRELSCLRTLCKEVMAMRLRLCSCMRVLILCSLVLCMLPVGSTATAYASPQDSTPVAWTQLSAGGGVPEVRYGHTAVYDSANQRIPGC